MDADALRALQAPIKDRYRAEPGAATITLRAQGTLDDAAIACKVETGRALAVAGLHPATGGGRRAVLGRHAARGARRLRRRDAQGGGDGARDPVAPRRREAEGDLDFRGTLGVDKAAPVGFKAIRLHFALDTDAPREKVDQLVKLTERYCVVFQTPQPAARARRVGRTVSRGGGRRRLIRTGTPSR